MEVGEEATESGDPLKRLGDMEGEELAGEEDRE